LDDRLRRGCKRLSTRPAPRVLTIPHHEKRGARRPVLPSNGPRHWEPFDLILPCHRAGGTMLAASSGKDWRPPRTNSQH
jgi:hypothetical protein